MSSVSTLLPLYLLLQFYLHRFRAICCSSSVLRMIPTIFRHRFHESKNKWAKRRRDWTMSFFSRQLFQFFGVKWAKHSSRQMSHNIFSCLSTCGCQLFDLFFTFSSFQLSNFFIFANNGLFKSMFGSAPYSWVCDQLPDLDGSVRQDLPVTVPAAFGFAVVAAGLAVGADGPEACRLPGRLAQVLQGKQLLVMWLETKRPHPVDLHKRVVKLWGRVGKGDGWEIDERDAADVSTDGAEVNTPLSWLTRVKLRLISPVQWQRINEDTYSMLKDAIKKLQFVCEYVTETKKISFHRREWAMQIWF